MPCLLAMKLSALLNEGLADKVTVALSSIEPEMLARAADYLYLSETRSTYTIENEIPDNNRAAKFRRLLESAGEPGALSEEQLCQWQNQIGNPLSAEYQYRSMSAPASCSPSIGASTDGQLDRLADATEHFH